MLKAKLGDVTRAGGLGGLERGIAALLDPLAPSAPLREFLCLPSTERRLLTYLLVLHRSLRRNKSLGFGLSVIQEGQGEISNNVICCKVLPIALVFPRDSLDRMNVEIHETHGRSQSGPLPVQDRGIS